MRIRVLPAAAAAVLLGATAAVVIAQNGDRDDGRDGAGGAPRGGSTRGAAPFRELKNTLSSGAASAAVKRPAAPGDFNGDGYRDIAGGGIGFVVVIYGGPAGSVPARRQVMAHPGAADSIFDWQFESADFDSDGYADLLTHFFVIGEGTAARTATTAIVYGGPRGLTSRTAALPEATGGFAVGDFDGNGVPDVAATGGVPKADLSTVVVYANPGARPGKAIVSNVARRGDYDVRRTLLAGDFTGDHRTDLLIGASNRIDGLMDDSWLELRAGVAGGLGPARLLPEDQAEGIDAAAAVAGDFDGDGRTDLVTKLGGDGDPADGAQLVTRPATARGFGKGRRFNAASLGIPGQFADVWRTGDVNADGLADLIVGSPSEDEPGAVSVLFGSRTGLTTAGRQTFRQDSRGVPGAAEPHDRFGDTFSLTDTDRDGRSELVVGAPGQNGGKGALYIFPGTATGRLTTKGIKYFDTAALGIGGENAELGGHLPG